MEVKNYQHERALFEDFQRYNNGDMRAGRRVAAEVAATGVKLSDIAHAAAQYAAETPLTHSTEATQVEVKMAGDYLHADTMKILRSRNLENTRETYSAAFRDALRLNPGGAAVYGVGRRLPKDSIEALKRHASRMMARRYKTSAVSELNNRISGFKNPDGIGLDTATAVSVANSHVDRAIITDAARESFDKLVAAEIQVRGIPSVDIQQPGMLDGIKQQVRRKHPALALVMDGGELTVGALVDILPKYFR